jgi:hypothetical protein
MIFANTVDGNNAAAYTTANDASLLKMSRINPHRGDPSVLTMGKKIPREQFKL